MIFVTVGTHLQPFNRLLEKTDELAGDKVVGDVFIQVGHSDYHPKFCTYKKFVGFYEFQELVKQSDAVITHAGAGTILNVLSYGKPAIVVPRLKKYGEHTNDHQLQIAKVLEEQEKVIPVYDIEELKDAIERAGCFKPRIAKQDSNIIELIEDYLADSNLVLDKTICKQ